jgi:hypothetical protein
MLTIAKNLYDYRELMATLAWKQIAWRRNQSSACSGPLSS